MILANDNLTKSLRRTNLWRVPVDGGEGVRVLDSVRAYANVALVPAGIYFIPNADWSIQFFDLASGKTTRIITIGRPEWGLTVSPDERWILYTQVDQEGSDLMLVENFR